jgi:hypothetical protein
MSLSNSLLSVTIAPLLVLLASCGTQASDHSRLLGETLDPPSTHGMLVVGEGPVFFSHLPMFHRPHDYQALIEVTLAADGVDALAAYKADRAASGETVYTFVPARFSLNALVGEEPLTTLPGALYRGHFERGGTKILEVTATVAALPHFRRFVPGAPRPKSLTYAVFGGKAGAPVFLAHRIVKAPDFDHVLTGVTLAPVAQGTVLPSLAGATLTVPGVADAPANALVPNKLVKASLVTSDGAVVPVTVKARGSPYLETGELSH